MLSPTVVVVATHILKDIQMFSKIATVFRSVETRFIVCTHHALGCARVRPIIVCLSIKLQLQRRDIPRASLHVIIYPIESFHVHFNCQFN